MWIKPLSQWELSSGDIELTRCKFTVKAICFGLVSSANYPDQWSDATIILCKLHSERVSFCFSVLGGAAYAAVSRAFRSVLHRLSLRELMVSFMVLCQSSVLFKFKGFIRLYFDFVYISRELSLFPDLVTWFKPQTFSLCHHMITNFAI